MTRFRLLLAGLLAVLPLLGAPASASAAEDAPISWSVTPADGAGPDGRVFVEHEIDAGATVDDRFAVRNLGAEEVTFRLSAADGFYNANGRFDMLPSDQESVAAGTWIDLPETVTVAPGGTAVVPFSITVPDDAEPGDHAAGIAASVVSSAAGGGTGVGVESRVGFKVMTRVTGELRPEFAVRQVESDYSLSWNPLRPGRVTTTFTVANTGNARLVVEGALALAGRTAAFPAEGERRGELLPGEERAFVVVLDEAWPLLLLSGDLTVTPLVSSEESAEATPSATAVTVWAVPWPQLLILAGVALLIVALWGGRIRSKRRLRALLAEAEERGRREAQATDAGGTRS